MCPDLWFQKDTEIGQETLSVQRKQEAGTDNHKQITQRGVGKKSVFSVDPKRLASDRVVYGDCHLQGTLRGMLRGACYGGHARGHARGDAMGRR